MHDHTCSFCAHTFTGRRRKFCYECLPAHGDIDSKGYQDRYNGLSAACGFLAGRWYSKWEPPGGWPNRRAASIPRVDHPCAGCDKIVSGKRKWCSSKCAANNKRHGVRRDRLAMSISEPERLVASTSTAPPRADTAVKLSRREQFLARCADLPVLTGPCVKCGGQLVEWWTLGGYGHTKRRCCYVCYLTECADRAKRRSRPVTTKKRTVASCNNCGSNFVRTKTRRVACTDQCSKQLQLEAWRRKNMRRRTANVGESYTIRELRERDGDRCHLCNKPINFDLPGNDPRGPHIDHLVPLSDGGADCKTNVKMAHARCNLSRGTGGTVQLLLVG